MLPDPQVALLVRRYQERLAGIGARAAGATTAAWDALDSYDRDDIEHFAQRIKPVVTASKATAVALASGFYSTLLAIRPPAIKVSAIAVTFDPTAGFAATWHALKEGRSYAEAVAAGRSMTEASTSNTMISASRRTGDAVIEASGQRTVGWRRVLDGKACEWCQLVSTQRYRTAESADFGHDRCGCTAVPIIGDRDPGRVVNRDLLAQLKSEGVVDKISKQQQLPRAREGLTNAEHRVERLRKEVARETNQERETRLEQRLDKARQDVKKFEQRVADLQR